VLKAGKNASGIAVKINGKSAGDLPVSTRVTPGRVKVRLSREDDDLDLDCLVEVGDGGRVLTIDGRNPSCPD
jgi:hypothetical protein